MGEREPGTAAHDTVVSLADPPSVFEERYGAGSRERLVALFKQPCVTFATIALRFGVSRERVRQWHRDLLPDAPTGHARQRLCALNQQRRRLLRDPLFRAFLRDVRSHFGAGVVQPIPSRHGYRSRVVRLEARLVALRDATRRPDAASERPRYRYRGTADYVYVCLGPDAFLFLPASAGIPHTPSGSANLTNLEVFKNTFDALTGAERRQSA